MRFDLKFLLRIVTIVSLLLWAIRTDNPFLCLCALVLVAFIGAISSKKSIITSSVRHSLCAGAFMLAAFWIVDIYKYSTHTESYPYYEEGFFLEGILAPIFIGVAMVLPISWILGIATGLILFWCREIGSAILREIQPEKNRKRHSEDSSAPN